VRRHQLHQVKSFRRVGQAAQADNPRFVLSALLALCLAYLIWYTAIQAIGVARTSLYSNLVPVAAMAVAAVWLGEPITSIKVVGATAVLTGLWLTRLGRKGPAAAAIVGLEE